MVDKSSFSDIVAVTSPLGMRGRSGRSQTPQHAGWGIVESNEKEVVLCDNARTNASNMSNLSLGMRHVMGSRSDTPTSVQVAPRSSSNATLAECYGNAFGETFYEVIGSLKGTSIETIENCY